VTGVLFERGATLNAFYFPPAMFANAYDPQGAQVSVIGSDFAQIIERADIEAGTYVLSWEGSGGARVYNFGATPPAFAPPGTTWALDGTANVVVELQMGSVVGKIQLERGTVPTTFEWTGTDDELRRCRRFFYRLIGDALNARLTLGYQQSTTQAEAQFQLPVPMRAVPTLAFWNTFYWTDGFSANAVISSITPSYPQPPGLQMLNIVTVFTAMGAAGRPGAISIPAPATPHPTAGLITFIDFDAEL
jgi:hypothetical protein